jgi:hypothetical protein
MGGVSARLNSPIVLLAEQAQALGLREDEVVMASVESLPSGVLGLLVQGQVIPFNSAGQNALVKGERYSLKARPNANGSWTLAPWPPKAEPEELEVGLQATPSRLQWAPLFTGDSQAGISHIAKLLYRPQDMSDLSELVQPGVLSELIDALARPDLLESWEAMLLSEELLSPETLQETVLNFLGPEAWLAKGKPPPGKDLKGLLRRLLSTLEQGLKSGAGWPAQVMSKLPLVRGALEDLESAQVRAVQAQGQNEVLFKMVLPFKEDAPIHLTFRRASNQWGQVAGLCVNVYSESPALGAIWLKTELQAKDRVDLTMWAIRSDVLEKAQAGTDGLVGTLKEIGLTVGRLEVLPGPRPDLPDAFVPSGRGLVVDIAV